VFDEFGKAQEVVQWREVEKPVIKNDDEVLVRIRASPIHPSDLMLVNGTYGIKPKFPAARLGSEAAGVIEEIGKAVHSLKVGQRVHVTYSIGAWSEYIVVNAQVVVPIPDELSFEEACQLSVNPLTVLGLIEELGIKKGEYLLQTAASSSLGRILIQFAKLRGIKTINVVRSDERVEELKAIGADFVINSTTEDLVTRVKEIAGNQLKHAIDAVAGDVGAEIVKTLGHKGTVLVYGVLSKNPYNLDIGSLIFKEVNVRGFWLVKWSQSNMEKIPALFKEVIEHLVAKNIVFPSHTFDAKTQLKEAITYALSPGKAEKAVLLF